MEKNLEKVFLIEIEFRCQIIISSCNDLAINIKTDNIIRCWTLIQSILNACSNISKIFSPPIPRDKSLINEFKERGEYLKNKLSISETSYLLSRYLQNDFEHLDERLHSWSKKSTTLVHRNIEPLGFTPINRLSKRSVMTNFDPNTFILTFWKNEIHLKDIFNESRLLLIKTK